MIKNLFFIFLLFCGLVKADVPAEQVKEVDHLLSFIKNSGCTINRNGTNHASDKAGSHIKRKYDYYRDDIKSTEDFIALAATKSTMSGDFYTVSCPGKEIIKTQDWLLTELKEYRAN